LRATSYVAVGVVCRDRTLYLLRPVAHAVVGVVGVKD